MQNPIIKFKLYVLVVETKLNKVALMTEANVRIKSVDGHEINKLY
jgi:hypothetical protein